jgi:hypothetical protein
MIHFGDKKTEHGRIMGLADLESKLEPHNLCVI